MVLFFTFKSDLSSKYFGCRWEPRQYCDNSILWIIDFKDIDIKLTFEVLTKLLDL